MQQITRETLIEKASAFLENENCACVLGWRKGEFDYDITPSVFTTKEDLEKNFVWNDFCGANLSKYLINTTAKYDKTLVFLKPCDTYSFNQLLTEHRFYREKVYAVGVSCEGMTDINKVKAVVGEGIEKIDFADDGLKVTTLYEEQQFTIDYKSVLAERCHRCKSKKHVAYDELLGKDGEVLDINRFDEVEALEKMTPDERFSFWQIGRAHV